MTQESDTQPTNIAGRDTASNECLCAFARHVHNYLQEFVQSSDQKVAFLLVAATALFGLLYKEVHPDASIRWVKLVAMVFAGTSVGLSVWTVMPRQQNIKCGLVAWEGIVGDRNSYRERVQGLLPNQLIEELLNHSEKLAQTLHVKYKIMYWAVWSFMVGAAITAILLVVLSLHI